MNLNEYLHKAKSQLLVAWSEARHSNQPEVANELKELIDRIEKLEVEIPETVAAKKKEDDAWKEEVRELVRRGKQMDAMKLHRSKTGCDLREAMFAVDKIKVELNK